MRDEEDRRAERRLHLLDELEDLGLDRHVEGRRRLVRDEEAGVARERDRDERPLLHPPAQLVRVLVRDPLRVGDLHPSEHPDRGPDRLALDGKDQRPAEELDEAAHDGDLGPLANHVPVRVLPRPSMVRELEAAGEERIEVPGDQLIEIEDVPGAGGEAVETRDDLVPGRGIEAGGGDQVPHVRELVGVPFRGVEERLPALPASRHRRRGLGDRQPMEDEHVHEDPRDDQEPEQARDREREEEEPGQDLEDREHDARVAGPRGGLDDPCPASDRGGGERDRQRERRREGPQLRRLEARERAPEEATKEERGRARHEEGDRDPGPAEEERGPRPARGRWERHRGRHGVRVRRPELPPDCVPLDLDVHLLDEALHDRLPLVEENVLRDLGPNREHGVQGLHRLLKDHRDLVPADLPHLLVRLRNEVVRGLHLDEGEEALPQGLDAGPLRLPRELPQFPEPADAEVRRLRLGPVAEHLPEESANLPLQRLDLRDDGTRHIEQDFARFNLPGGLRDEPEDRKGGHALPGPCLPDEPQRLPLDDVEVHPVERLHDPCVRVEVRAEVPDAEQEVRRPITSGGAGPRCLEPCPPGG